MQMPLTHIRRFVLNVSASKAPVGSLRVTPSGAIATNLGGAYTPTSTGEYWEMSAFGYTKAVLTL